MYLKFNFLNGFIIRYSKTEGELGFPLTSLVFFIRAPDQFRIKLLAALIKMCDKIYAKDHKY